VQVTAQRLAVLRAVAERPHSTAADIGAVVRAEIGAVSLQAVYDALGTLAEKGIIRRIQPAGSPARYEHRVGDNHHHLICRTCGRMVDVDCRIYTVPHGRRRRRLRDRRSRSHLLGALPGVRSGGAHLPRGMKHHHEQRTSEK
jgi:Fe2+ or Zn2+ uptake regulation protein